MCGCGKFLAKVVLVIVNIIFLLISLAMIVAGALVLAAGDLVKEWQKNIFDGITNSVQDSFGDSQFTTDNADVDLTELLGGVAIALIVIGAVFFLITIFGIVGACCDVKPLMLIYTIVIIIVLIGTSVGVGLLYGKPDLIKDQVKDATQTLIEDYKGLNSTTVHSLGLNFIMRQFSCCGAVDYKDFDKSTGWWAKGSHVAPIACCKTLPGSGDTVNENSPACAKIPTDATSNWKTSCVDELWKFLDDNESVVIPVIVGIFVCEVLIITFGLWIFCSEDEKNSKTSSRVHPSQHQTNKWY